VTAGERAVSGSRRVSFKPRSPPASPLTCGSLRMSSALAGRHRRAWSTTVSSRESSNRLGLFRQPQELEGDGPGQKRPRQDSNLRPAA
jgi:hypothetical protein